MLNIVLCQVRVEFIHTNIIAIMSYLSSKRALFHSSMHKEKDNQILIEKCLYRHKVFNHDGESAAQMLFYLLDYTRRRSDLQS